MSWKRLQTRVVDAAANQNQRHALLVLATQEDRMRKKEDPAKWEWNRERRDDSKRDSCSLLHRVFVSFYCTSVLRFTDSLRTYYT